MSCGQLKGFLHGAGIIKDDIHITGGRYTEIPAKGLNPEKHVDVYIDWPLMSRKLYDLYCNYTLRLILSNMIKIAVPEGICPLAIAFLKVNGIGISVISSSHDDTYFN